MSGRERRLALEATVTKDVIRCVLPRLEGPEKQIAALDREDREPRAR